MSLSPNRWRESQVASSRNREFDDELQKRTKEETEKLKKELDAKRDRIKELENELLLSESQFARAIADSEAAASRAASKDKDMSDLMKSIQDIQAQAQRREEEANKQRRQAEAKVSELEKALAVTKGELNVFNHERSTLKDTLDSAKQERSAAMKNLEEMKKHVDELKADLNSTMSQLTLEKELRARSEQKEREERNERIALSAQMVAMTKEHAHMETTLNESKSIMEAKWRKEVEAEAKKENKIPVVGLSEKGMKKLYKTFYYLKIYLKIR
jgi:chromosome segregation ATPase